MPGDSRRDGAKNKKPPGEHTWRGRAWDELVANDRQHNAVIVTLEKSAS